MANTSKLSITYTTASGETRTMSFNRIASDVSTARVRTLCSTLVTHGAIYNYPPVEIVSAKLVTTSESEFDL